MSVRKNPEQFIDLVCQDDSGLTRASIAPTWGANVIAISYQAAEWSYPAPILEPVDPSALSASPSSYGIPILAPTPGRVGKNQSGEFTYRGKNYRIKPTRHGFLRHKSWKIQQFDSDHLICRTSVDVTNSPESKDFFPFHFNATASFQVSPAKLTCRVTLENTAQYIQPLDLGWHPYFYQLGNHVVQIPAGLVWELDSEQEPTPTGKTQEVTGLYDFRSGRQIDSSEHWDHIFTGLDLAGDEAHCYLEEVFPVELNSGISKNVRIRKNLWVTTEHPSGSVLPFNNIQLYTPAGRRAIALEPLSAPPDAINMHSRQMTDCLSEVAPGEKVTFTLVLQIVAQDT